MLERSVITYGLTVRKRVDELLALSSGVQHFVPSLSLLIVSPEVKYCALLSKMAADWHSTPRGQQPLTALFQPSTTGCGRSCGVGAASLYGASVEIVNCELRATGGLA